MVDRIASLNGWSERVGFRQAAAGAEDGYLEMVETGLTGAGYVVLPKDHPQADRRKLPMLTVDHLASEMGEPPTLVKVDVESFELDVLRGGRRTFAERGTPLFLEIHNAMMRDRGVDPRSVIQQLRDYGYQSFQIAGRELSDDALLGSGIVRVLVRRSSG